MTQKKVVRQSMAERAAMRMEEFSAEKLHAALGARIPETCIELVMDIGEKIIHRLAHHPEIDNQVKDEFLNDIRMWGVLEALVKDR
jgi:uncharacterized protein YutE (UPF0331/DUF86 family)